MSLLSRPSSPISESLCDKRHKKARYFMYCSAKNKKKADLMMIIMLRPLSSPELDNMPGIDLIDCRGISLGQMERCYLFGAYVKYIIIYVQVLGPHPRHVDEKFDFDFFNKSHLNSAHIPSLSSSADCRRPSPTGPCIHQAGGGAGSE